MPLGPPLSPQEQAAYQAHIGRMMRQNAPPGPMPMPPVSPGHFQDWGVATQAPPPGPQTQGPPTAPPPPFNAGPPMPPGPLGAANAAPQNPLGPPAGIPGMPGVLTPEQAQYYAQTVRPPMGGLSVPSVPPPPGQAALQGQMPPGATMPAPLGGPPMPPQTGQPAAPTGLPAGAQAGMSLLDYVRAMLASPGGGPPGTPGGAAPPTQ